jgi:hypothetical protein
VPGLYEIADGKAKAKKGAPAVVICLGESGPLNLPPRPGRQRTPRIVKGGSGEDPRRRRRRATCTRKKGVRHLLAAYHLKADKIYGHIKMKKDRATFLEFCRYAEADPQVHLRGHRALAHGLLGRTLGRGHARWQALVVAGRAARAIQVARNRSNPVKWGAGR